MPRFTCHNADKNKENSNGLNFLSYLNFWTSFIVNFPYYVVHMKNNSNQFEFSISAENTVTTLFVFTILNRHKISNFGNYNKGRYVMLTSKLVAKLLSYGYRF